MKKKILFVLVIFLITGVSVVTILISNKEIANKNTRFTSVADNNPKEYQTVNDLPSGNFNQKESLNADKKFPSVKELPVLSEENNEYYSSLIKKEAKGLVSQRKLKIKGKDKAERPDLFREWEAGIRIKEGAVAPEYDYNYKLKEMLKSRSLTSTRQLSKLEKTSALTWVERGPGNVSGRTRGIIVDPDDSSKDTWFAGSVSGGIWKTTDAGESWVELTKDLPNLATSTLAMAPSNHNVIYAGTGEGFFNVDQVDGSGIWKSTDRGVSWQSLASTNNNPDFQNVTRIIVDPSDENIVLVSATAGFNYTTDATLPNSGIFRSTDGGNNWTMVYDAGDFSVEQIVANPSRFNTMYATINSTGIIKSIDGGLTWTEISNGIGPVGRLELAIAPTDTSVLYFSAEGGSGSVLYISDDGGANWFSATDTSGVQQPWLGTQGWYDNTIAVDPYDANKVYVGGINLWRLDRIAGTDTIKEVQSIDQENTSTFLSFVNWSGPYAGGGIGTGDDFLGSSGVVNDDFVSVEIRFGPGLSQKAHRFVVDSNIYKYQDYVDVPFEVWDIDNDIQLMFSFRDWADDGVFDLITFDAENIQREYMFVNAIAYNENTPDSVISGNNSGMIYKNIYGIWPILTSGGTWDPDNLPSSILRINYGETITKRISANVVTDGYGQYGGTTKGVHVDHHNIILEKTDEGSQSFRLINGNDGGVSYSDDKGATFIQPTNGYNTTQFYGIDKMNGEDRYVGGTQDNGSWMSPVDPDETSEWTSLPSGDGFEAVWHYDNSDLILESSQFNNIFKSTDGGISWTGAGSVNGLTDQGSANSPFFTKLAKSKQDPDLVFAIGNSGVWRSDDFASSWNLTPMPSGFNGTSSFAQVKISLINPQIVWAGQGMSSGSRIFVSTDGGLSFDTVNNYTDGTLGRITSFETDPSDDSTAYALFSFAKTSKILKTTNLGETWTDISGFNTDTVSAAGFPDVAVLSLLVMPYDNDIIWAGTEIGIYQTTNGGTNWSYVDNNFPAAAVYEMLIVNDEVVIATHGRGIWTVSLPELSGYEPPAAVLSPRLNLLGQNPQGLMVIPFDLRSAYDSTHIIVNSSLFQKIGGNSSEKDTAVFYPVMTEKTDTVQVISYKNGMSYLSAKRSFNNKLYAEPQTMYTNNFNTATDDFFGSDFTVSKPDGFADDAIHTKHPYDNNENNTYQLLIPIIVASSDALIHYEDIAIVEPGDPGSVFGDENFWDYVIFEGSKDGLTWLPLSDGYDAGKDSAWLANYGGTIDSSLFRMQSIDLLDTFSPEDTIIVRLRLFADVAVNGWGWVVDNLSIQGGIIPVELISFAGSAVENKITLKWGTATEKNNSGFEIQRSIDKKEFTKIGFVQGRGTTTEEQTYSYLDNTTNGGKFYYRLKQIDYDGSYGYSDIIEVTALPTVYELSQNYPNPFNPTTKIKFQLPLQEKVVLEIYNTLGERVKTLVNEVKDPGFYEVTWDGRNNRNIPVSTGVYIYRIIAGKFVISKKMMFMK